MSRDWEQSPVPGGPLGNINSLLKRNKNIVIDVPIPNECTRIISHNRR